MADPTRLVILKTITAALGDIPDLGTTTGDLSENVFRGRTIYGDDSPIPMLSILEPPIPLEAFMSRGGNPNQTGKWELLIQGWAKDDPNNPTDPAHILMAKVKEVFAKEKARERGMNPFGIGSKIKSFEIGQGSCRPADEVSVRAYFWLLITLQIVEKLDDPFA